jgi:hypothetical protein
MLNQLGFDHGRICTSREIDCVEAALPAAVALFLLLKPEMWPAWLGEEPATARDLKAMLAPYPSEGMIAWPVSTRVGSVKNNDPSLIEPVALS